MPDDRQKKKKKPTNTHIIKYLFWNSLWFKTDASLSNTPSSSINQQPGFKTSIVINFCVLCLAQVRHALVFQLPMTTSPKVEFWMALHYSGDRPCASHRHKCLTPPLSLLLLWFLLLLLLPVVVDDGEDEDESSTDRMDRLVCTRCCYGYAMHNVLIIRWKLCANTRCYGMPRECRRTYTMYIQVANRQFSFFCLIKFVFLHLSLSPCLFITSYNESAFNVRVHTIAISMDSLNCEWSLWCRFYVNSAKIQWILWFLTIPKNDNSKSKFIFRKWVH